MSGVEGSMIPWLSYSYWQTIRRGALIASRWWWPAHICFALYTPVIYYLQRYMRDRPPYKVKAAGFVWNVTLSLLSLLGVALIVWEDPGVTKRILVNEEDYTPFTRAVTAIFAVTKGFEFGDTVFLVLRKRPVIFLHWYHHITVALYSWHAVTVTAPFSHNCAFINLGIHTVMYFYYAMGVVVPRHPVLVFFRPYITSSQTVQMFVGMFLSWRAIAVAELSPMQYINCWLGFIMYTSYAYLFAAFYVRNYMKGIRQSAVLWMGTLYFLAAIGVTRIYKSQCMWRQLLELCIAYGVTTVLVESIKVKNRVKLGNDQKYEILEDRSTHRSAIMVMNFAVDVATTCLARHCTQPNSTTAAKASLLGALLQEETSGDSEKSSKNATAKTAVQPSAELTTSSTPKSRKPTATAKATTDATTATASSAASTACGGVTACSMGTLSASDYGLAVLCILLPWLYGIRVYNDYLIGICAFGCLRWVIELHSTGKNFCFLMKNATTLTNTETKKLK